MNTKKILGITALALLPLAGASAGDLGEEVTGGEWHYSSGGGLQLEHFSFDSAIAKAEGFGDTGNGIGGYYIGEYGPYLSFNVGATFIDIDDEDKFSVRVEGEGLFNDGDQSTESSDIDAGALHIEGGVKYPVDIFTFGFNTGYRFFDVDREVSLCRNCPSDDISIESATYFKPYIGVKIGWLNTLLAFTSYNGDNGVEDSASLSFEFGL